MALRVACAMGQDFDLIQENEGSRCRMPIVIVTGRVTARQRVAITRLPSPKVSTQLAVLAALPSVVVFASHTLLHA